MRMKIISSSVIAFGLMASGSAMAQQAGTVDFEGEITDSTCSVAADSQNKTVTLPTVSTNAFSGQGTSSGLTAFAINLENCSVEDDQQVSAYFEPYPNVDLTSGNLVNTDTGAEAAGNVQVQLLNSQTNAIDLSSPVGANGLQSGAEWVDVTPNGASGDGTATINYFAQYYAMNDQVTAGTVASSVNFTVTYP